VTKKKGEHMRSVSSRRGNYVNKKGDHIGHFCTSIFLEDAECVRVISRCKSVLWALWKKGSPCPYVKQ
jgi:hypothetical protein